ncbi:phosphatidylglycerophosphatase and protein-tyrosine phosphatase 1 isoform X2 [Arvicanthis niloticus]|uniref:phosphatidylglycerophosphatase and protein-tyrosine phosphatase 1 isoform X2 n=1 Tax=Arvicanthis niloticus TaxID=61156 RepID=UPI00402BE83B
MVPVPGSPGTGLDSGDSAAESREESGGPQLSSFASFSRWLAASPEAGGWPLRLAGWGGSPLRLAGWGGMAASAWLEAGLARVLFYPTLLYTVFRGTVRGPAHRDWFHRIDHTVLLGALPLRSMTRRLVQDENVHGVITMNEEYETRFLCNTSKEWKKAGVEQLRLSTVDMTGVPTLANLHRGVQFALKYQSLGTQLEPRGGYRSYRQNPVTHLHQAQPVGSSQRVPQGDCCKGSKELTTDYPSW